MSLGASVKGPSVTVRFPPENLTRAPMSASSFSSGRTPASEFLVVDGLRDLPELD